MEGWRERMEIKKKGGRGMGEGGNNIIFNHLDPA